MLYTVPSEDEQAVAELAAEVGMTLLDPAARATDDGGEISDAVWTRLMATQLTGPYLGDDDRIHVPPVAAQLVAAEKLAYGDPGIALAATWSGCATTLLAVHGTADQQTVAHDLIERGARATIAMFEGYGRGYSSFATTISRSEDDALVSLRGTKAAVAFAGRAEVTVVMGVDANTGEPSAVIVSPTTVGHEVERRNRGSALNATDMATIQFEVTTSPEMILGGKALNAAAFRRALHHIRLVTAAVAVGTGQRAVDYAAAYAQERVAFGRPIAGFQGVSFPLAESHTRLHQARVEIADLATTLDQCEDVHDRQVSRAIAYATEAACEASRAAVQTLGGNGFMLDYPVGRWYRAAAALSALDFDPLECPFSPAL